MAGRFEGKVAIVTGGASGIGAAVVERLIADGARVVVADLNEPKAALPASASFQACDVTQEKDIERLISDTARRHGRIDLLVNNAGIGLLGETPEITSEDWRRVMAVNIDAIFFACRAAIPHMRSVGGGAIVNTASISGLGGDYAFTAYNASKGAVINYTRALAIDHAREGIRVNAICPGLIAHTGLTEPMEADRAGRSVWDTTIPMGRAGSAKEMANVICFLLSDEASYMTGAIVVADGGVTAHTGQPNVLEGRRQRAS
jgi:meso-butanediol dehydrogenase/(S,S)-butanediol dehydrogenase/diacetyl reductase